MSDHVLEFNDRSFETSVMKSDKPVLVDFWAVWCGPCRQVSPVVEALADKWGEKVVVGKVNVDDHPAIAEKFGVQSIPTLILFKGGQMVERIVGMSSQASLEKKFEPHIA